MDIQLSVSCIQLAIKCGKQFFLGANSLISVAWLTACLDGRDVTDCDS